MASSNDLFVNAPLVWIELGRGVPKYLQRNIAFTREIYPNARLLLVTDSLSVPELLGIEIIKLRELVQEDKTKIEKIGFNWRGRNQRDFWINTSLRFQILLWLMEYLEIQNAIHLESDCIPLELSEVFRLLQDKSWGIAYPLQTKDAGCASIFVVNKRKSLQYFVDYMIKQSSAEWQDDMQLLGRYCHDSNDVLILPTKIGGDSPFIFDAQSIGKFYFGTDARNNRFPFRTRAKVDSRMNLIIDNLPNRLKFNLSDSRPGIQLSIGSSNQILCNLHLHSKDLPKNVRTLKKMCRRAFGSGSTFMWRLGKIDWIVVKERLLDGTKRRLVGEKKKPMKYFR